MIKRNGYLLAAVLFGLSFMTACSKNLMPPEGLDATAPVSSQMSSSSDPKGGAGDSKGAAGRGFNITEEHEARTLPFKDTGSLQDIHFNFDRYDLDDDSRSTLRENAAYLKANSSAVIEIQGHCDERGTNNYNVALGERRAHSTKMYLVSQGVSASRVHTISYGEERPFCFDSNAACWQKNRRAHFRISE